MGVEFYTCENCRETFSDYGKYVSCETCSTKWCCDECAEEDGYVREHCKLHPDLDDYDLMYEYRKKHCKYDSCTDCEHYVPGSCKYCRNIVEMKIIRMMCYWIIAWNYSVLQEIS